MAQVGNQDRFGGEFMIQDSDHMSDIGQSTDNAKRGNVRQSEQSQAGARQHGSRDNHAGNQQGGERRR